MFKKYTITEDIRKKIAEKLLKDREWYGEAGNLQSAFKAIDEANYKEIALDTGLTIKGYLVPVATKENKETRQQKTLYMVIGKKGLSYLLDKYSWIEYSNPVMGDDYTINHIYTPLEDAHHALVEEVCDNWPGEWHIVAPK